MRNTRKKRRKLRIRAKVKGTKNRPRLTVFRSNKYVYAQLIDDTKGVSLASVSDREEGKSKLKKTGTKLERASIAGRLLAEKAKKKQIRSAVFDRAGYKYHGRVKALADGARKGGLKF